jgi:hypothetical protein
MATQKFHLPGLEHGQEASVQARVRAEPGVLFAVANHQDACLEVEFEDDIVTTAHLRNVLAQLGFQARLAG